MSVNMMAASFRCSAFWEGTNALKQRLPGMKPAIRQTVWPLSANPASVGQGGAVRRSATDTMWKTIHNHPEFHELLAGPKQIGFSQAGRNEFATFFRRAEAA